MAFLRLLPLRSSEPKTFIIFCRGSKHFASDKRLSYSSINLCNGGRASVNDTNLAKTNFKSSKLIEAYMDQMYLESHRDSIPEPYYFVHFEDRASYD